MDGTQIARSMQPSSKRGIRMMIGASIALAVGATAAAQPHVTEGLPGLANPGVEIGDIDGDGRLDLISLRFANGESNFVTYRGEGYSFSNSGTLTGIGAINASGLAIGDLNGDGRPDVVTSALDSTNGLIRSYVGVGTPSGSFAVIPLGSVFAWRTGALVDLDLDGDLDLVAIDHGKIFHLRNSGVGNLSLGNSVTEPMIGGASPSTPIRLAVADFDNDGDYDAAGAKTFGTIVWFRNTLTAGNATLATWLSLSAGTALWDFTATDLHGDGDSDLAAVGLQTANELLAIESLGSGNFGPTTFVAGGTFSSFVVGGDFDLDGRGDLVTERTVHRSLASGPPTLHAQHVLPEAFVTRLADFNGDSRLDLLAIGPASNSDPVDLGALILNDGTGRFASRFGSESSFTRGGFALAELDGDSALDLLTLARPFASPSFQARIETGDGAGKFTAGASVPLAAVEVAGATIPPAIAADLNGDGRPDLVVADGNASKPNPTLEVALPNGSGGFQAVKSSPITESATILHVGRVNADPFLDVILERVLVGSCEYRVAFNDGLGNLTQAAAVTASPGPPLFQLAEPVAVADVTSDGLDDLIVRTSALGALRVLSSVGDGSFVPSGTIAWANDGVFTVAELTGDAIPDLALLELVDSSFRLVVRPGTGGATFAPAAPQHVSAGFTSIASLHALDFDGDGIRDLLGVSSATGGVVIYRGSGGGFFDPPVFQRIGGSTVGYPARVAPLIGEVNGDDRLDLVGVRPGTAPLDEIVVVPGDCGGRTVGYGHGCPGAGGFVPKIAIVGAPCPGEVVTFEIRDGLGGSFALVFLGGGEGAIPVTGGCDLLLAPLLPYSFAMPLSGAGPGQGEVAAITLLPSSIDGATITMQAFVADPTFAGGVAASAGLAARFED